MKTAIDQSKLAGLEYARGSMTPHEGAFLRELVELIATPSCENPSGVITAVEIGSWIGVSTVYLAQGAPEGMIIAIDPHEGYSLHKRRQIPDTEALLRENLKRFEVERRVKVIRATSMNALKEWKSRVDLLFIDGNHLFKFVREDFFGWSCWIPSGGVLAFHDYPMLSGPRRVIDEIVKPSGLWEEVGHVQRLVVFRRKK